MCELDVAVKTIPRQHVNPHLTPEQALQAMQKVTGCCFAAVVNNLILIQASYSIQRPDLSVSASTFMSASASVPVSESASAPMLLCSALHDS